MANIKSAAKRAKRSLTQRVVNRRSKAILKGAIKAARSVKANTSGADIQTVLSAAYSVLDRSVYKGILHKNAAARHKQRLEKLLRGAKTTT